MKQNFASALVLGGGLRHQHADTHLRRSRKSHHSIYPTLGPASLFVADGGFLAPVHLILPSREKPDAQPSKLSLCREGNIQND